MTGIEYTFYLPILFFSVAVLYSMLGFGGGSSYIALLMLFGISYKLAPSIALICNIIVVLGGTIHFIKNGSLKWSFVSPFLLLSVPMAFLGGFIQIDRLLYQFILALALLAAASRMIFFKKGF